MEYKNQEQKLYSDLYTIVVARALTNLCNYTESQRQRETVRDRNREIETQKHRDRETDTDRK